MAELGLTEDLFLIDYAELGGRAQGRLVERLGSRRYDCVLVGGGIRKEPGLSELFQVLVDLVHWHQPSVAFAFNGIPADNPDRVLRALEQRSTHNIG